ncbi:MAG: hypothetical protein V4533_05450 [Pseudomonadota bacterium]
MPASMRCAAIAVNRLARLSRLRRVGRGPIFCPFDRIAAKSS